MQVEDNCFSLTLSVFDCYCIMYYTVPKPVMRKKNALAQLTYLHRLLQSCGWDGVIQKFIHTLFGEPRNYAARSRNKPTLNHDVFTFMHLITIRNIEIVCQRVGLVDAHNIQGIKDFRYYLPELTSMRLNIWYFFFYND